MERNQLISNIRWTKDLVGNYETKNEEIRSLDYEKSNLEEGPINNLYNPFLSPFSFILGFGVFWFIIVATFGEFMSKVFEFVNPSYKIIWGALSWISIYFLIPVTVYVLVLWFFNKKMVNSQSNKQKVKECVQKIMEKKQELQEIMREVHSGSVVPRNYLSTYSLEKFETYLNRQRADSLKECINIYEQEESQSQQNRVAQERHDEKMREMQRQNKEMIKAVGKVKDQVENSRFDYYRHNK